MISWLTKEKKEDSSEVHKSPEDMKRKQKMQNEKEIMSCDRT